MSEQATEPESRAPETGSNLGLLVGLPLLCAAILGGWAIWRQTADLDDIEARQLAWGTILTLTREHVTLTLITTAVVLVTAIPIGILLTRGPARRFSGPITAVANAGQAAPVIGLIVLLAMWLGFGVRTAVIGCPVRYMHTSGELARKSDLLACRALLAGFLGTL